MPITGHIEPALTQNAGKGGEGQTRGTTVAHDERTKVASLLNRTVIFSMSGRDLTERSVILGLFSDEQRKGCCVCIPKC